MQKAEVFSPLRGSQSMISKIYESKHSSIHILFGETGKKLLHDRGTQLVHSSFLL